MISLYILIRQLSFLNFSCTQSSNLVETNVTLSFCQVKILFEMGIIPSPFISLENSYMYEHICVCM